MKDICINCGKWKGLHKWDTMQCPFGNETDNLFLTNQFYAEENDEIAALRAERDELREALETSTSLLDHTDKYGTFPPPQNPYTPNAIKRAVIANRAVLAKYEEAQ